MINIYGDDPIKYLEQAPQRMRERIADLERQVADLLAYNQTRTDELAASVAQVAALTKENSELSEEIIRTIDAKTHWLRELAASQAREKLLCELQWKNIRHVVSALADWAFGSKDDPRWGTAWIAMTTGLSAKDGPQFTLELLPTDDTALQARLKEEREKCAKVCDEFQITSYLSVGTTLARMIRELS